MVLPLMTCIDVAAERRWNQTSTARSQGKWGGEWDNRQREASGRAGEQGAVEDKGTGGGVKKRIP